MGITDDAKDAAGAAARKLHEAWEDATDRVSDRADVFEAEAKTKKAETEEAAAHAKKVFKERLRED